MGEKIRMNDTALSDMPAMRPHHSDVPLECAHLHTLIIEVEDAPGAIDRVVGVLRRRRALIQTLSFMPSAQSGQVRVTAQVSDAHVVVDHVVEQIRKIVDVRRVEKLDLQQTLTRELALIQVDTTRADMNTIIDTGQDFGAAVIDVTPETVTFEVTGRGERIDQIIKELAAFGVREISRSGCVAMARLRNDTDQ